MLVSSSATCGTTTMAAIHSTMAAPQNQASHDIDP